jgi:hypothetical protein
MNCVHYPLTYNEYYSLKRVNTYLKPCNTPNWLISCPPPVPESVCCPHPVHATICRPPIPHPIPSCTSCHSNTHCIDIMAVNNQSV